MKTVQDYLDFGLVFVDDDMIQAVTGEPSYGSTSLARCLFKCGEYPSGIKLVGSMCGMGEWTPSSFAWRNNDGVKPEYKGLIEVECESGCTHKGSSRDFMYWWDDGTIIKWRPVVLQSESPTVSTKEGKPMKPVYTAEMHARNELPPVDSKVKVCIEEAGFYVDEQDVKFEGKAVTVKAAFSNTESEKIVAVENEDGNCYCYIIECIKPIIKTIKVNGFDVPAPMSEAPDYGSIFFKAEISNVSEKFCDRYCWGGTLAGNMWLKRGIIHSNESAATAHAKAMLGIDPNA